MNREQYNDYVSKFNNKDYDAVFNFYSDTPKMSFFGVEITTRDELKAFYGFLHSYVKETITVEKYAFTDDFVALEGIVRVEGIQDLDTETLQANGYPGLFPIKKGDVQEMRQYIHYHLRDGKIDSVGCAIPAA